MVEGKALIKYILSFNYINNFKNQSPNFQPECCFVHGKINYVAELEKDISDDMSNDAKTVMKIENIISRNKIIIGFDDLQNDKENFELEFVDYRKYFQRIYKGTDSQYVDWLNEYHQNMRKNFSWQGTRNAINNNLNVISVENQNITYNYTEYLQETLKKSEHLPNQVFIFGHSLDSTDNEIFKDIFLREFNDTKIVIYYHDADARKRIITNLIKILTKPVLVQKTKGKNPVIEFVAQTYKS